MAKNDSSSIATSALFAPNCYQKLQFLFNYQAHKDTLLLYVSPLQAQLYFLQRD